jgi:hypothetical protein
MEIAIPSSTLDTSSPQVFLKEISSDGNVNTVDVVLPTFPILYVLSPSWIRFLLQPYLTYMNTGAWPYDYIVHDMGSSTFIHAVFHTTKPVLTRRQTTPMPQDTT